MIELLSGDADAPARESIEAHVRECDECRRTWTDLTAALSLVHETVPEPPAGFEHLMWTRVRHAIGEPAPARWTWRQWAPAAALAATVLVAAGVAGWQAAPESTAAPIGTQASVSTDRDVDAERIQSERVLYTALDTHLEQTEALLVELRNAPDRATLGFERDVADDLLIAGRLYRATAEYTGNQGVINMLDDLEPVLLEVARGSGRIDRRDRERLRANIDGGLLFKVRAVSNEVRERVDHPGQQ